MTRLAGQVALDQGIDLYHRLHVQVAISEPYEVSSCRNLHDSDSPLLERVRLVVSGAGLPAGRGSGVWPASAAPKPASVRTHRARQMAPDLALSPDIVPTQMNSELVVR